MGMYMGRHAIVGVWRAEDKLEFSCRCAPHIYFTCVYIAYVCRVQMTPISQVRKPRLSEQLGPLQMISLSRQAEEHSSDPEQPQLTARHEQRRVSNALMLNIGWKHFRTFRRGSVLVFLRLFQY